jgi:fumarate reductase subunit D
MSQTPGHWLFVTMLATVPCPSAFLLCNGFLSVSTLSLEIVTFVAQGVRKLLIAALLILAMFPCTRLIAWTDTRYGGAMGTSCMLGGLALRGHVETSTCRAACGTMRGLFPRQEARSLSAWTI